MGAKLDERSRALAGEPSWIRGCLEVYSHPSHLKAHDWLRLIQDAGDYILHELYPDHPNRMDTLYSLIAACGACILGTSAHTSDNREQIDRLKLQVIEALCKCEAELPKTEHAVMFHILMHIPDLMYRWNAVRNFWNFFGERYVHHLCILSILYTWLCVVSDKYVVL